VPHDIVHRARPDQKRIRGIGGAEIAVPTALHDQPEIVLARKIYGDNDVLGSPSRDGVDAGLRCPCVDPARGLGQAEVVADIVGIFQSLEDVAAGGAVG
jgi:hypothetical protein